MATLRYFAGAREAVGASSETIPGVTVGAALAEASARHGDRFTAVLAQCRVWLNGEPAELDAPVGDDDEIAVLPPVSGGSGPLAATADPAGGADPGGGPVVAPRTDRPRHRVVRRRRPGRPALSPPTGPHVRLGILWAVVTLAALLSGTYWLTAWMVLVVAMAAGSAARTWGTAAVAERLANNRRVRVQPPAAVAALLAALITLAALAGGLVVAVVAAAAAVALVAAATFGPLGQPDGARRVVIVLGPGVAGACLVLARAQGLATGLVLAGMVTVFDSSAYLIGTGAPNRWEGSVAGVASIAALTLFVAGVLAPPFTGSSPWLLGGAAAALAPVGPALGRWVTGDKAAPVPALRRLDSLFLVGPAWVAGVALLLHH
jgi:molybdopterin converting factor small subunit